MGRKKKEEKKEYLYYSIGSIVLIFIGVIFFIVKIQGQNTPVKAFLNNYLGLSSFILSIFLIGLGVYLSPMIKIKHINKRVLAGILLLFTSFLLFDFWFGSNSILASMVMRYVSGITGSVGAVLLSITLFILSLYLIFSSRFIRVTNNLFFYIKTFDYKSLLNLINKKEEKEAVLSKEEEEIFNMDNLGSNESTEEKEEVDKEQDASKQKENSPFEVVNSLSEPVTLVKSDTPINKKTSTVSSIGSINNYAPPKDKDENEKDMDFSQPDSSLPYRNSIWEYPPLTLLSDSENVVADIGNTKEYKKTIENTLNSFGVNAKVVDTNPGPAVTQYALRVDKGVKTSKITNLANDLALALASPNGQVRIEAPIPGKSLIGVEVPNISQEIVFMRPMLTSSEYKKIKEKSKLNICLGKDVGGNNVFYPLNKMPHLLIAGATGSGKSVMIQSLLTTILFANSPDECKLILVDPKRVELGIYKDIPHLITPVITEPSEAVNALKWVVGEMDRRLQVLAQFGSRNIEAYNEKSGFQAMPYIVVVLDELADLMMTSSNEVEKSIVRIAQLSRATGIHLVIATQRPSTDIITGSIKANVPARIAFNVASQVDSRVILDSSGAEKLLGKGDMLFVSPESSKPTRIQGVFVEDEEINRVVSFLKASDLDPNYNEEITSEENKSVGNASGSGNAQYEDELFPEAVKTVVEEGKGSASLLQRRLSIGYARAARILDELEENGIVGPSDGSKPRDLLIDSADEVL